MKVWGEKNMMSAREKERIDEREGDCHIGQQQTIY